MLRISKLADYSVVLMCHLAKHAEEMLSAKQLAAQTHIPIPTVSKLLKLLGEAGLIQSVRGVQGGYLLCKPPSEISVADVVIAIDGDFAVTECGQAESNCALSPQCGLRGNWQVINQQICRLLSDISIVQMQKPLVISEEVVNG